MVRKVLYSRQFKTFTLEVIFRPSSAWVGVHKSIRRYTLHELGLFKSQTYCMNILPCLTIKYTRFSDLQEFV